MFKHREISTINIPSSLLEKLYKMGYYTATDVLNDVGELNSKLGVEVDWESLLKTPPLNSARSLFDQGLKTPNRVSFDTELNELLKDILKEGLLTELVGLPGSGRTDLCLNLCISIQLPGSVNGRYGEALYICTNSKFNIKSLKEMVDKYLETFNEAREDPSKISNGILKKIHYVSVTKPDELLAYLLHLNIYLKDFNVKFVVINSLAFVLRQVDSIEKTSFLCKLLSILRELSLKFNFSVLLVNDLTTVIIDDGPAVVPYLRDSFLHLINTRLLIENKNKITIVKSSEKFNVHCCFKL